jgi:hypothetical protein
MPPVIFFSYSHVDRSWLEKFQTMLAPLVKGGQAHEWSDKKLLPGSKWRQEIAQALNATTVAVLLVSPEFLASDFIQAEELPKLLKSADNERLTIFWVYLRPCMYKRTAIADYQAAHDIAKPLSQLTPHRREMVVLEICEEIAAACSSKQQLGPTLFPPALSDAVGPLSESLSRI